MSNTQRDRASASSHALAIGRRSTPMSKSAQKQMMVFEGVGDDRALTTGAASSNAHERANARKQSHAWLDYPPAFEKRVRAVFDAIRKVVNPGALLTPLPPAARFALTRNFSFVAKTFTQFFDPDGVKNVQESIGLGK